VRKKILKYLSLALGPVIFILFYIFGSPSESINNNAWLLLGVIIWMAIWWITEVIPIAATSLIPIIVFPLSNIEKIGPTTAAYANPIIYLFLGGFIIAIAMEKLNLHKRIALASLLYSGSKPSQQIMGVMIVTAFWSMWMSNTATAAMMLPIAFAIIQIHNFKSDNKFSKAILLAIAYSASIGGIGTIIGSPPNALLAGYLNSTHDIQINFVQWMMIGLPIATLLLAITWVVLTKIIFKVDKDYDKSKDLKIIAQEKLKEMGNMSSAEKKLLIVFSLVVLGWIFQQQLNGILTYFVSNVLGVNNTITLNDTIIVLIGALSLFIIKISKTSEKTIIEWADTKNVPWGVMILIGGGLAVADQVQKTGIADLIASFVGGININSMLIMLFIIVTILVFLTEVTNNTATAAGFIPLLGPISIALAGNLLYILIPATIGVSLAFMLPSATPPNSIVFASGEIKIKDMMIAGLWLNIIGIIVVTLLSVILTPIIF
jgi:solute carrier family 13 (sodium-dependent dicarboxylate transporter), member 2/3/5